MFIAALRKGALMDGLALGVEMSQKILMLVYGMMMCFNCSPISGGGVPHLIPVTSPIPDC